MSNIPQYLLEQICLGEKKAKDYYSQYGKENLDNALNALKQDNESILQDYPSDLVFQEVNDRIESKNKAYKRFFINPKVTGTIASIAACLVLVFSLVLISDNGKNKALSEEQAISSTNRIKSQNKNALYVYRMENDGQITLLDNNSTGKQADTLQIAFKVTKDCYALLISIDGNGVITTHYSAGDDETAVKLKDEKEIVFSQYAYVLDDAPLYEAFILVTSDKPFCLTDIKENITAASLKQLTKDAGLDKDYTVTSYILNK